MVVNCVRMKDWTELCVSERRRSRCQAVALADAESDSVRWRYRGNATSRSLLYGGGSLRTVGAERHLLIKYTANFFDLGNVLLATDRDSRRQQTSRNNPRQVNFELILHMGWMELKERDVEVKT